MGSKSDWPTMKFCTETLKKLQVKFDAKIIELNLLQLSGTLMEGLE